MCSKAWPFWRAQCTLTWNSVAPQKPAPGSSAVAAVPAMWAGLACQTGRKKINDHHVDTGSAQRAGIDGTLVVVRAGGRNRVILSITHAY